MSLEFMGKYIKCDMGKYIKCDLLQKKGPLNFRFSIVLMHLLNTFATVFNCVSCCEPISSELKRGL